jgi:hypothetical protein
MRPRTLLIVPALAVLGTGAAFAAGILLTGAPAGPKVPPVPTAGYGAANPATAKLLPLHVADPAGGLAWGLRTVRTTRGDVCLQVGRLTDGTIGALGEDGSFGDDPASTLSQRTIRTRRAVRRWTRAATASST